MSKNIFSYRTSLVAASDLGYKWVLFSCWLNFFGFNICKDIFHNIFQFKLFILLYGVMSFFVPKYFEKYKKYISEYISQYISIQTISCIRPRGRLYERNVVITKMHLKPSSSFTWIGKTVNSSINYKIWIIWVRTTSPRWTDSHNLT